MNIDRQHFASVSVIAAILAGTYRAFHHRRDDFEMRRVERHGQVDFATRRHDVGAEALVVFHVTRTTLDDFLAIELVDQIRRVLAQDVDQQIQAATVGHADHDFLGAIATGALNQFVHHRYERLATFQAEALGTRVLGGQVIFQAFRSRQAFQYVLAHVIAELGRAAYRFETTLQPALLFGIHDVHDFAADGAAVGLLQRIDDLAQRCFINTQEERTCLELGIKISLG